MTVDLGKVLWTPGKRVSFAKAAKVKTALAERFDSLDLAQQRDLIRQHLDVNVCGGRGTDRVAIRYLRAVALKEVTTPKRSNRFENSS